MFGYKIFNIFEQACFLNGNATIMKHSPPKAPKEGGEAHTRIKQTPHMKTQKHKQIRTASITKTYLYNFDPLKPHFYIVKLGFTGVYIIFLISAQNIDYGYLLELPH